MCVCVCMYIYVCVYVLTTSTIGREHASRRWACAKPSRSLSVPFICISCISYTSHQKSWAQSGRTAPAPIARGQKTRGVIEGEDPAAAGIARIFSLYLHSSSPRTRTTYAERRAEPIVTESAVLQRLKTIHGSIGRHPTTMSIFRYKVPTLRHNGFDLWFSSDPGRKVRHLRKPGQN